MTQVERPRTGVAAGQAAIAFEPAFVGTLRDVLDSGVDVTVADGSMSVGSGRTSREVLNYGFTLADGRDRLLLARPISAIGAIGRLVWMLAGNDRLADIAYYEPKVGGFTDDGLSVPGSDYGARLFRPRPGLDQVREAGRILATEVGTRRAAAAVYHPEDAGRTSHDIPCTFGLLWHVRDGALHATTLMRSNNAWTLLPYNVFEFTLLAEILAADLGVPLGSYYHHAVSMHVYEEHLGVAEAAIRSPHEGALPQLPAIPVDEPWARVRDLLALESGLRYRAAAIDDIAVRDYLRRARDLGPFWSEIATVLIAAAVRNGKLADSTGEVLGALSEPLRSLVTLDFAPLLHGDTTTKPDTAQLWLQLIRGQLQQPAEGGND